MKIQPCQCLAGKKNNLISTAAGWGTVCLAAFIVGWMISMVYVAWMKMLVCAGGRKKKWANGLVDFNRIIWLVDTILVDVDWLGGGLMVYKIFPFHFPCVVAGKESRNIRFQKPTFEFWIFFLITFELGKLEDKERGRVKSVFGWIPTGCAWGRKGFLF